MKKDLRIRILKHFERLDNSTAETIANDWLSKEHDDLGTIRRSLIDLVDSDFIRLSSIGDAKPTEWLKVNWDTTTSGEQTQDDKDKKSSRRLIEKVGRHERVLDVRLYTTVKGLMFIKEYRRFKNHYINLIILSLLAFVLGLLAHRINQTSIDNHRHDRRHFRERMESLPRVDSVKFNNKNAP